MFILDSNCVSELRKVRDGKADLNFASWANSADFDSLYLSAIVIQELEMGVLLMQRRDTTKASVIGAWLYGFVLPRFDGCILPVDTAVARATARLHVPDPRPVLDCLIASTAMVHGMTVVTRNVADFKPMGVSLLNPWESSGRS